MIKKIKDNKGQTADLIAIIFFFSLIIFFIIGFIGTKSFFRAQNRTLDIINDAAQYASIDGIFTNANYEDMMKQLATIKIENVNLTLQTSIDSITNTKREEIIIKVAKDNGEEIPVTFTPEQKMEKIKEFEKKYKTEIEEAIRLNMIEIYHIPETIINRTLKQGDVLTIVASAKNENLLGRILNQGFMFSNNKKNSDILKVSAAIKTPILVDGRFTGTQVLENLSKFLNEAYSSNLDKNLYLNGIVLKTYKYDDNSNIEFDNDIPKYSEVLNNGKTTKYLLFNGVNMEDNLENINGIFSKEPGNNFWINPNGVYLKYYEKSNHPNFDSDDTDEESDIQQISVDENGDQIYKEILVIEEILE